MRKDKIPLVSICCITYNHANFIRQCLDGFMMQEAPFLFEVLIHDDASTDGTADIIREYGEKYPDVIRPIYQTENQYSKGKDVVLYNFSRAKGKYIALCEGDDYWTDSMKLQKQVAVLEAHPEYNLCCHRYRIYDEENGKWSLDYGSSLFDNGEDGIVFDNEFNMLKSWLTKTMTVMFRRSAFLQSGFTEYKYGRDVHLFYYLLKGSKAYCMNYDAAVYRKHVNGVWAKVDTEEQVLANYKIYRELYRDNKKDAVLRQVFRNNFEMYVRSSIRKNGMTANNVFKSLSLIYYDLKFLGVRKVAGRFYKIVTKRTGLH